MVSQLALSSLLPLMQRAGRATRCSVSVTSLATASLGAAAVLAAQHEAEERLVGVDAAGDDDDDAAWSVEGLRSAPGAALVLGARRRRRPPPPRGELGGSASRRRTSTAQPAVLRSRSKGVDARQRLPGGAFRACARLCALTSARRARRRRRADGAAVRAVVSPSGSVDAANDADAARLVEAAPRWRSRGARGGAGDAAAAVDRRAAAARACAEMASALAAVGSDRAAAPRRRRRGAALF